MIVLGKILVAPPASKHLIPRVNPHVACFLHVIRPPSTEIQVGCYDIEISGGSEIVGYTGVDGDLCGDYSRG